jgi:hypothetical protein
MRLRLVQLSVVLCHWNSIQWCTLADVGNIGIIARRFGGSGFVILSYPALGVSCTPTSIDNAADRI